MTICNKCNATYACPECGCEHGHEIKRMLVCQRLVARNRSRQLKCERKKIARGNSPAQIFFEKLCGIVNSMKEGEIFSTLDALKFMDMTGGTKGDMLRIILDWNVCLGKLKRASLNETPEGNTYEKINGTTCNYLATNKNAMPSEECNFSFKISDFAELRTLNYRVPK